MFAAWPPPITPTDSVRRPRRGCARWPISSPSVSSASTARASATIALLPARGSEL
jgi:hypothetical protein